MAHAKASGLLALAILLICGAGAAMAGETCGNPCRDDQYWTDKGGGKCLPKDEAKTS